MPRRRSLRSDDPRSLGLVPPVPAPATSELVQRQVRRGLGKLHIFVAYIVPYYLSQNVMIITIFYVTLCSALSSTGPTFQAALDVEGSA